MLEGWRVIILCITDMLEGWMRVILLCITVMLEGWRVIILWRIEAISSAAPH
jgi:hypothetical protein